MRAVSTASDPARGMQGQQRIPAILLMQHQCLEAGSQRRALQILRAHQRRMTRGFHVIQKRLQPVDADPQAADRLPQVVAKLSRFRQAAAAGLLRRDARQVIRRTVEAADDLVVDQGLQYRGPFARLVRARNRASARWRSPNRVRRRRPGPFAGRRHIVDRPRISGSMPRARDSTGNRDAGARWRTRAPPAPHSAPGAASLEVASAPPAAAAPVLPAGRRHESRSLSAAAPAIRSASPERLRPIR